MKEQDNIPTFKLLIAGDGGVGKSTFVRRHAAGEFEENYYPNKTPEVFPIILNTSLGPV